MQQDTRRCRCRDLGLAPGDILPGPLNAITDVPGVRVGHRAVVKGPQKSAVCSGVSVVMPHEGDPFKQRLAAACHTFNGFGKAVGLEQIRELGQIETPIALTNTGSVGKVAHALAGWEFAQNPDAVSVNPVAGECNDSFLNHLPGQHITEEHLLDAIAAARTGPVAEGCVGAGAGMVCYGFKGGIGTASRLLPDKKGGYCLGALVLANFGIREHLCMNGIPVGRHLEHLRDSLPPPRHEKPDEGSIMMILATDAPIDSRQLGRLARRAPLGLARTGSIGSHGSGDFVLAFSTYNPMPANAKAHTISLIQDQAKTMNPLFQAVVETVEESVYNALCMASTTRGYLGHVVHALPLDEVKELLKKYQALEPI
jgi:D-aminopeptidase